MSKTINLDILTRAEKAGVHLVVDGFSDLGPNTAALAPPDRIGRCNVVAEARNIATKIATRKASHDPDVVYANSTAMLEITLKAMLAYIAKHMPKGKSDGKQADAVDDGVQQDCPDVVNHAHPEPEAGDAADAPARAKPKAARKT